MSTSQRVPRHGCRHQSVAVGRRQRGGAVRRARGASVIGTASEANHEYLRTLGAEPTTYGEGVVERVRQLAPDGVDRALDSAGRGALVDLIEITGSPDNVVTTADFSAAEHGVRDDEQASRLGRPARLLRTTNRSAPGVNARRTGRR